MAESIMSFFTNRMNQQMQKSSILFIAFTLIVIALLGFFIIQHNETIETPPVTTNNNTPPAVTTTSNCGLSVVSPLPNTTVTFPLMVQAVVDNTQMATLGCSWTVFEAQAGVVKVYDINNIQVGFGILATTGNWMTTSPVNYSATVTLTGTPATNALTLVFEEEDPSGNGNIDIVSIPVTL